MKYKKYIFLMVNIICVITIFFIFFSSKPYMYNNTFRFVSIFSSVIIMCLCWVLLWKEKFKTCKLLLLFNLIFAIVLLFYHLLTINNLLYMFSSVASFKTFILSTGSKGVLIYILIQMAQIVFLPIPASVIAIAGAIIYGPLFGAIYCTIGVLLGSYISFFIGRTLGYKIVCWVVGVSNAKKYANILNNNGRMFLGVAFLLPMFPDDILCLIAGLTNMKFSFFFCISTIFRPIGVFCMCFFGSGSIIPFSGWGIPLWIAICIIMLVVVVLAYKYQNKIEEWFVNRISGNKKLEN